MGVREGTFIGSNCCLVLRSKVSRVFMGLVQQDLENAPERIRHSEALVKKLV